MKTFPVFTPIEGHKPKLGKSFSWIIGAEIISNYFHDIPQYDNISIWFNERPLQYKYRMDVIQSEEIPYQIFTVWYSVLYEPHWFFMVYPIIKSKRKEIQKVLVEQSFPKIKDWLTRERDKIWYMDEKHFRCIYHFDNKIKYNDKFN